MLVKVSTSYVYIMVESYTKNYISLVVLLISKAYISAHVLSNWSHTA